MKCKYAEARLHFSLQFKDKVQEEIDNGNIKTEFEIRDFVRELLVYEIKNWCENYPESYGWMPNNWIQTEIQLEQ